MEKLDLNKEQMRIVNLAIAKCGSVDTLAARLGVCRQTVFKWRSGVHSMKWSMAMELMKWANRKK
jgi:DNA-binding XRE family transcriptional regulator